MQVGLVVLHAVLTLWVDHRAELEAVGIGLDAVLLEHLGDDPLHREVLEDALVSWDVAADDLVARTAEAALTGGEGSLADEGDNAALADTRALLKRALLAWAVVLALLAVLG